MVQYVTTLGLVALTGAVAFGQFGDAIRHGVRSEMVAVAEANGEQTDGPTGSLAAEVAKAGTEAAIVQGSWALAAKAGAHGVAGARKKQRGRASSGQDGHANGSGPRDNPESRDGSEPRDRGADPSVIPRGDPANDSPGSGVCRNGLCTPGEDGSNCFAAGTPVATPLGPTPIERLAPGDLVLSRDDVTGNFSAQRVSATFVTANSALVDVRTVSFSGASASVRVTPGHLFWTPTDTWVRADALLAGDILADVDGAEVRVVRVDAVTELATAYNLEVDGTHTYFAGAGSVWVHNGCWPSNPGENPSEGPSKNPFKGPIKNPFTGRPIKNPFGKKDPASAPGATTAHSDPTDTDPTHTDPTHTDPTHTDPTHTDPTHTDPTHSAPKSPTPPGKTPNPELSPGTDPPASKPPAPKPAPTVPDDSSVVASGSNSGAPRHGARYGEDAENKSANPGPYTNKFQTAKMDAAQIELDKKQDVIQLNPKELLQRKVVVKDGKLQDPFGNPIAATGQGPLEYVMDTEGNLYIAAPHKGSIFNHSQFLGNEAVAAAGMIEVDRDGKVVMIDNKSGHYKPGPSLTQQAVWILEDKGVVMPAPTEHVPPARANLPPPPMGGPPRGGPPTGGGPPAAPAPPRGKAKKKRAFPTPEQTGEGSGTPG